MQLNTAYSYKAKPRVTHTSQERYYSLTVSEIILDSVPAEVKST